MSILETSREIVKLATRVGNPELIRAAMTAMSEVFELSSTNLELQKRLAQLEKEVEELKTAIYSDPFPLAGRVTKNGTKNKD